MQAVDLVDKAVKPLTATIAISTSISSAVFLYGCTAVCFETPAAFTGTAITFQGSIDDGATFAAIKDTLGVAISYVVAASGSYPMDAKQFAAYDQIKVVSGSSEAAERLIKVKPFAI